MYIHNPHKDLRSFMAGPVTMNCKTDGISSISGKEYRRGRGGHVSCCSLWLGENGSFSGVPGFLALPGGGHEYPIRPEIDAIHGHQTRWSGISVRTGDENRSCQRCSIAARLRHELVALMLVEGASQAPIRPDNQN
jgi:hypothetical protein